ncbi:MAG: S-adenosylmethionine decarboxylase [Chloroflexi bacterium]|nr:S-adenosylmethionine decarboxylase [Chloroflexota bacterium]
MHLVIDGYGKNPAILADRNVIYDILDTFPAEIGMTKIAPPYVFRYVGAKPEDWGISGLVLIAESHISVHTFVDRSLVNIDVFSCKAFDAKQVTEMLQAKMQLTRIRSYLLDRGLEYCDLPMTICQPIAVPEPATAQTGGNGQHAKTGGRVQRAATECLVPSRQVRPTKP